MKKNPLYINRPDFVIIDDYDAMKESTVTEKVNHLKEMKEDFSKFVAHYFPEYQRQNESDMIHLENYGVDYAMKQDYNATKFKASMDHSAILLMQGKSVVFVSSDMDKVKKYLKEHYQIEDFEQTENCLELKKPLV